MAEHTPGPWEWEKPYQYSDGSTSWALSSNGRLVLRHAASTWTVSDANARLIAAAPELLKALRALFDASDLDTTPLHIYQAARAALAKAEGQEQP